MLSNDNITRVVLVRHGRTEWNRVERFRGRADVPLDATGLAQADAARKADIEEMTFITPLKRK